MQNRPDDTQVSAVRRRAARLMKSKLRVVTGNKPLFQDIHTHVHICAAFTAKEFKGKSTVTNLAKLGFVGRPRPPERVIIEISSTDVRRTICRLPEHDEHVSEEDEALTASFRRTYG